MKTIYFLSNNLVSNVNIIYPKNTTFNEVREKTMLSIKGEETAKKIAENKELSNIEVIFSSPYYSSLDVSKYVASIKDLDIIIDNNLSERIVGVGANEYRFLKGMQEHDFNYKLNNGESLNDVMGRMLTFLRELLKSDYENVLVVTHNVALLSLMLRWCNKNFNLEDRLILDYKDDVIFDGAFHEIDLIKMEFDEKKLMNIERII
jgi:2,3-bisphosphoglycerate-dependent phosphoglycerate mutase